MTALQDDYTPQTTAGLSLVEHPGDLLGRLGPHYDGIKFLAAIRDGELPPPPIASLLGFEIRDIAYEGGRLADEPWQKDLKLEVTNRARAIRDREAVAA